MELKVPFRSKTETSEFHLIYLSSGPTQNYVFDIALVASLWPPKMARKPLSWERGGSKIQIEHPRREAAKYVLMQTERPRICEEDAKGAEKPAWKGMRTTGEEIRETHMPPPSTVSHFGRPKCYNVSLICTS